MLRLQPSELTLTVGELEGVQRRLEQRRTARLLFPPGHLHGSTVYDPHSSTARIRRGPARSCDEAITYQGGSWNHSVASSSDEIDYINAASHAVSDEIKSFCGLTYHHMSSGSSPTNSDDSELEADAILDIRNIQLNVELDGRVEDDVHPLRPLQLERPSTPLTDSRPSSIESYDSEPGPHPSPRGTSQPHRVAAGVPHPGAPIDESTIRRLTIPPHEQSYRHRRFRPRSWSDPSEMVIPQLSFPAPRRLLRGRGPSRRGSSSSLSFVAVEDVIYRNHTRSRSATVEVTANTYNSDGPTGSLQNNGCEGTRYTSDLRGTTFGDSAIVEATSGLLGPLETMAREYRSDDQTEAFALWTCELPIRSTSTATGRHVRWPTFASDEEPPTSPICPSTPTVPGEEDDNATPKPESPTARHHYLEHRDSGIWSLRRPISPARLMRAWYPDGDGIYSPIFRTPVHPTAPAVGSNISTDPSSRRFQRRPLPGYADTQSNAATRRRTDHSGVSTQPRPTRAELTEQLVLRQRSNFYHALAEAHSGSLPLDAHNRWLQFLQHLAHRQSHSEETPHRSHALRRRPVAARHSDVSLQQSESAGNRGLPDPFAAANIDRGNPNPRGLGLEFAVSRGGRPRTETTWRAPVQVPTNASGPSTYSEGAGPRGSSLDQENIDGGEALGRFELERQRMMRLAGVGGVMDEDEDTPPGVGRLGRFGL